MIPRSNCLSVGHAWDGDNVSLTTVAGWKECMAAADQVRL